MARNNIGNRHQDKRDKASTTSGSKSWPPVAASEVAYCYPWRISQAVCPPLTLVYQDNPADNMI